MRHRRYCIQLTCTIMVKKLFSSAFFLLFSLAAWCQGELNATVRINTPQLQQTDRRVFDQLEASLRDFLNNTKWTNDVFELDERIKCNFIITIAKESDNNVFEGELAVQSTRPVYGSGYETPMISYLDKDLVFIYEQNQPIEFIRDAADNQNLPAMLAFYVYIILGMDYDSFSPFGGDPHYATAERIVTNVQNSGNSASGWRPGDGGKNRNRYWIIENLLNPRVKPMRAAMHNYYRNGLDMFSSSPDQGREAILQALEEVDKVYVAYLNCMIVQMFSYAKRDELVELWKLGTKQQKERVIQIMTRIDPANSQRYREIGS
ncbi:MAG: DUF4835 family protein [Bacteroidota bacterium]